MQTPQIEKRSRRAQTTKGCNEEGWGHNEEAETTVKSNGSEINRVEEICSKIDVTVSFCFSSRPFDNTLDVRVQ